MKGVMVELRQERLKMASDEHTHASEYLTRSEAASYLNVPAHWLANNTKTGPRFIKIGGLVRYSVAALDAFMAAHECRQ
ncbi:helix-turn-helix domain-containing protein [Paenarthrobacter ureafaciens]|uniref:helix-turn-helix domain-containing protein n=1 Tax=Paenarthrobacter ureafaciens TaxID=37931 RepID=UPI002DBA74D4|nr:helix-turn-helix domain-containing protein [Paenarthrobacter ureafaciens]MEC3853727.1 helix-turn-helix domain-containing protein [Paenarthrobacter ureafaciens]